jgi:glycosyltransferase involved in cell wall biosynthesis
VRAVGVVSLLPFFERDGICYLPGFDAGSHRCWTDHFATTVLLKPQLVADRVPDGWQPLEGAILPRALYRVTADGLPGYFARRRTGRAVLREAAAELPWMVLRPPACECSWALDAVRAAGTKLLVELHGDWESAFRVEWKRDPLKRPFRHAAASWADRRTRLMAESADVLCCVGGALREKYGAGREAHVTTAHLVPEAAFRRRSDTCTGETLHLLAVGALVARKGLVHLLDAVVALRRAGRAIVLDVVGDGPLRAALEHAVHRQGLEDVVVFHGDVGHGPRLLDFFRRADVYVLPSIAAEGVPRAIQEAMASSCPVVACDVGSVRQQLGDGRFGGVVPPGDAAALADAIDRVIADGAYRRARIEAAYQEAHRYSYEHQRAHIRRILEANLDADLLSAADQVSPITNSRTRSTT